MKIEKKTHLGLTVHTNYIALLLKVLIRGIVFVDVQFGITATKILSQGASICGVHDVEESKVSSVMQKSRFFLSNLTG